MKMFERLKKFTVSHNSLKEQIKSTEKRLAFEVKKQRA